MRFRKIPDETVRRLPIYLRGLRDSFLNGRQKLSSSVLAESVGVNAWQIRKDFSYFGEFGIPGVGYQVDHLIKQINKILKLDTVHKIALVGAGNLGAALIAYPEFKTYGFHIVAAFDNDIDKIGAEINGVVIEDVAHLSTIKDRRINLAIIAVPAQVAQQITDMLVDAGVKGILNFSPCRLAVPKKVKVLTINIGLDLARLPYYVPVG